MSSYCKKSSPDRPKYVTKYTDEDGLRGMLSASFRLGSLSEYRKTEQDEIAKELSLDPTEGLDRVRVHHGHTGSVIIDTPDEYISAISIGNRLPYSIMDCYYDRWVFCTSIGPYSKSHHEQVILPRKPSYTEFVTIDVDRFEDAILTAAHETFPSLVGFVCHQEVDCDLKGFDVDAEYVNKALSPEETVKRQDRSVFIKPKNFIDEKEYRFLLLPPVGTPCRPKYQKQYFESEALYKSIENSSED